MSELEPMHATLEHGVRRMLEHRKQRGIKETVVYTGDWHDAIPRRLILDPNLTPTEKIIWQVLRTHCSQPGENGSWPSIGRLATLACVSRPTVQNAIDVLQAARWISVIRRIRDEKGAVIGNYYLLHGAPLPIHETMVVTPDYLDFLRRLSKADGPSKKRVQSFAVMMLKKLKQKVQTEQKYMNKLDELADNMEVGKEASDNQSESIEWVRESADKVRKESKQQEPAASPVKFVWPDVLKGYKQKAMLVLADAPAEQRQGILNAVGKANDIRNPLAYLGAIVKKAKQGLFFDETAEEEQEERQQAELLETLESARQALQAGKYVTYKGMAVHDISGAMVSLKSGRSTNAIRDDAKSKDIVISEAPESG